MDTIIFHFGALSDSIEEQVNRQGFTYGDKSNYVQSIVDGMISLWIENCITDKEYDKIIERVKKKILINKDYLKKVVEVDGGE